MKGNSASNDEDKHKIQEKKKNKKEKDNHLGSQLWLADWLAVWLADWLAGLGWLVVWMAFHCQDLQFSYFFFSSLFNCLSMVFPCVLNFLRF